MPYTKEYYEANRVEILAKSKTYREQHREEIKERQTKYNIEHKKENTERKRIWAKEKYTCVCGSIFRRDRKSEHEQLSKKHKEYCEPIMQT